MKITTFNPLIVTTQAEETIKLFEEMGFERHHTKRDTGSSKFTVMVSPSGFFFGDFAAYQGLTFFVRSGIIASVS